MLQIKTTGAKNKRALMSTHIDNLTLGEKEIYSELKNCSARYTSARLA
jgi:hypothetical protein